jgi:hypothetical protein
MAVAKAEFLKASFVALLQTIPTDAAPLWGKMTLQQMVEHFTDAVRIAAGLVPDAAIVSPEEHLPKLQAFIRSEKPFRENTRNPLLPETPAPVRARSIEAALDSLQEAIDAFFEVFAGNEHLTTRNPIFGDLDYDLNIQLLYKHALHHLRQFGVDVAPAAVN